MKYQNGDKVVIKIDKLDATSLNKEDNVAFYNKQILGKLEDFTPAEEKIKMTVEEKKEFDELKRIHKSLFLTLKEINIVNYPNLCERLFCNNNDVGRNKAQLDFSRAWDKPSRIEVEEKKYKIKILNGYLYNLSRNSYRIIDIINYGDNFTQSEIDELQKQEQFKAIDLNKCKEKVEDE